MFVIIGGVIVLGCVLAGFMMAGGQIGALIHPSEFVTIGGAAVRRVDSDDAEESAERPG